MPTRGANDIGSVAVAALILIFGALVIWETTTYADFDSGVFPRTVALVMVALCLLYIVLWLAGLTRSIPPSEPGSWLRRILLVVLMLVAAFVMPWTGFLLSSIVMFALLTALAMYEPWTAWRAAAYPLIGLAIVIGFYVLFGEFLRVPLPEGRLFGG